MAKVVEDVVVVKFSKLVKDDEVSVSIASPEIQSAIEQVAQELVGSGVIVEVVKA